MDEFRLRPKVHVMWLHEAFGGPSGYIYIYGSSVLAILKDIYCDRYSIKCLTGFANRAS